MKKYGRVKLQLHSQSGGFKEAIISLPLPQIEPISLVTIPSLKILYAEASQGQRTTAYYYTCSSEVQIFLKKSIQTNVRKPRKVLASVTATNKITLVSSDDRKEDTAIAFTPAASLETIDLRHNRNVDY